MDVDVWGLIQTGSQAIFNTVLPVVALAAGISIFERVTPFASRFLRARILPRFNLGGGADSSGGKVQTARVKSPNSGGGE